MKGGLVKEHFSLTIEVAEGRALRDLIKDFRMHCAEDPNWYGLHENEDEALAGLVDALAEDEVEVA